MSLLPVVIVVLVVFVVVSDVTGDISSKDVNIHFQPKSHSPPSSLAPFVAVVVVGIFLSHNVAAAST